ncbi:MAG TPA: transcription antitermination factor NusB [Longimicrobiales bacterium]|nr:transcription antitermination factor NusB [Longimicrobiales bacterium]
MTEAGKLHPRERLDRSRARAWLLQIHYRWESEGGERTLPEALSTTMSTRRMSPRRMPYVRRVLGLMDEHLPEIDAALRRALDNWRLDRLSKMDRAVLRIAATEMLYVEEIPPKVAIQEAIRLAESYGGEESPRFVNGVLDALYKRAAS